MFSCFSVVKAFRRHPVIAELKAIMVKFMVPKAKSSGSSQLSLEDMERSLGLQSLDDIPGGDELAFEQLSGSEEEEAAEGELAETAAQKAWEVWSDACDAFEEDVDVPEDAIVAVASDAKGARKPSPEALRDLCVTCLLYICVDLVTRPCVVPAFQSAQESAAPLQDAKAAFAAAKAVMKDLPGLLAKPVNLVLRQQQQARAKKIAAPDATKSVNDYSSVMAQFKTKALRDLRDLFPNQKKKAMESAVRQSWLDSEERKVVMESMSEAEKIKRRFLPAKKPRTKE